jgi:hypothetical protein
MLDTAKLRNVYKRHDVTHTCFNGFLIGPAGGETDIPAGAKVKVAPIAKASGLVFEVFMPIKGKKGVRETWVATKVPGDERKATKARVERLAEDEEAA